jgi:hypothetical protein
VDLDDLPMSATGMSPRTALLAGLVLGIAMMVGLLGFLTWRDRVASPAGPSGRTPSAATPAP